MVWELELIRWFQQGPDWLLTLMTLVTDLGSTEAYLIIITAFLWCFDSRLGLRLALLLPVAGLTNDIFKMSIHGPRPFWVDGTIAAHHAGGSFGMPSGHSQSAAAMWTGLAASKGCWWIWPVAVTLIVAVGQSRIFLGVHFPTQVLTGWTLGLLLALVWLRYERPVANWFLARSLGLRLTLALALGLAGLGLVKAAIAASSGWVPPREWLETAAAAKPISSRLHPFSIKGTLFVSGILSGGSAGAVLLHHRGWFTDTWSWANRAGRYGLGVAGLAAVIILTKLIGGNFSHSPALDTVWRYLSGGLVGIWVAGGAPWLFLKTGLAEKVNG